MRRTVLLLIGAIAGCFLLCAFFEVTMEPFAAAQTVAVVTKGTQQDFPICLTDTLHAVRLASYDGPFLEDGTDEEVVGIAALELVNTSSQMIEGGEIALYCIDRVLHFDFTNLPPGERLFVLEQNRSLYGRDMVVDVKVSIRQEPVGVDEMVAVTIKEPGSLTLENTSDRTLTGVRVFYKTYDAESKMYIGGITYSTYAGEMEPSEIRSVTPYHVAYGYTQIVKVIRD